MPNSPARLCSKCGVKVYDGTTRCSEHKVKHNWADDKIRGNRHERGYGSEWEKTRKIVLKRDDYLCVNHKAKGIFRKATDVDHIIPKERGGTDNIDNLQSLCSKCHREKTAKESN